MTRRLRKAIVAMAASALALAGFFGATGDVAAARVKDIAAIKGVRENQIIGYGLVVGLNGTGDREKTEFTVQSLTSLLGQMGIGVDPDAVRVRNVAAVMVTAMLHPFARTGTQIDATVSSLGDSSSLEGGTLLMTPLHGSDGQVYAIGQGPLSIGGFSAGGGGSSVQKNHPTVGRLAGGVTVERELAYSIEGRSRFELALARADFTTALRLAAAINGHFGMATATARDAGTLELTVPAAYDRDVVGFLATVESLTVDPDRTARVVLNERTGTVVMGAEVAISRVAVSHGNLSVTIATTQEVSQPNPFGGGRTVPFRNTDVTAVEEGGNLALVGGPVTVDELVRGLNALGVTPRDLIAILQAIRAAGALSAEMELL
ncbi:flagellar basal body P-ring protein FlgI [Myxococcota bacterium]|nr:flagellar basal body P-ring protein FlgI [Myxococcota bacterium]